MLIHMREDANAEEITDLERALHGAGKEARAVGRTIVVLSGEGALEPWFAKHPAVAAAMPMASPYRLVHRSVRPEGSRIQVGPVEIGGPEFVIAAGPCAVEDEAQLNAAAEGVAAAGARLLRGGAFKPRTSPYSFRGLEEKGLALLAEAGRRLGLPVVTEVMAVEDVPLVAGYADILQIGARNMQNFNLLEAVGASGRPVLLKRGLAATVEELLLAAEYIALQGNLDIILCERGIRTFESSTRNTLDLASAVLLRELTHLPVIVDPSHATGRRELVGPLSKAAAVAGVAGLIVEVHPDPARARCDGPQSLTPAQFAELTEALLPLLVAEGRRLAPAGPGGLPLAEARRDRLDAILADLMAERVKTDVQIQELKAKMERCDGYELSAVSNQLE